VSALWLARWWHLLLDTALGVLVVHSAHAFSCLRNHRRVELSYEELGPSSVKVVFEKQGKAFGSVVCHGEQRPLDLSFLSPLQLISERIMTHLHHMNLFHHRIHLPARHAGQVQQVRCKAVVQRRVLGVCVCRCRLMCVCFCIPAHALTLCITPTRNRNRNNSKKRRYTFELKPAYEGDNVATDQSEDTAPLSDVAEEPAAPEAEQQQRQKDKAAPQPQEEEQQQQDQQQDQAEEAGEPGSSSAAAAKKKKKKKKKKSKAGAADESGTAGAAETAAAGANAGAEAAADDEDEKFEDALSDAVGADDTAEDQRQQSPPPPAASPEAAASPAAARSPTPTNEGGRFDPAAWESYLAGPKAADVGVALPGDPSGGVGGHPARGPVLRYGLAKHAVKSEDKWLQAPNNTWQPEGWPGECLSSSWGRVGGGRRGGVVLGHHRLGRHRLGRQHFVVACCRCPHPPHPTSEPLFATPPPLPPHHSQPLPRSQRLVSLTATVVQRCPPTQRAPCCSSS